MQSRKALIVGAGRIAGLNELDPARRKPCTHVGALRAGHVDIAGVVDADMSRATEFAGLLGIGHAGTSLDEALFRIEPDIVTVAVPYWHQHDVVAAIAGHPRRPRKLLLEKPLAANLAHAQAIVDRCRKEGLSVLVNNECAAPVFGQMKAIIAEEFGNRTLSVSAWCSSGMHAVGIHMLGALRLLFGPIAWVRSIAETERVESLPFSTNFTADDPRIHGMLMFESGVSGFLTNSALTSFTYKEIEVMCRHGKVRLSDNGNLLQVWRPATPGQSSISYGLTAPVNVAIEPATAFSRIGQFLGSDEDTAGQDVLGGDIALEVYRALDALVRSAREGREIKLKETA
jgi:predicted dehydrogenase